MQAQAISKYIRVSPFRARQVTRLIQGKTVPEAVAMVQVIPQKAARLVSKTLRSAIANAENSEKTSVSAEELVVKEAVVGEGPTMRRFRPKARGMAGRIRKRTSHIKIVVTDEA
ncbi:MAG: 50S ribosomal protein L22 [Lentisphaerae bacterium]|jgi:large subunit ribosomal protein L22|nr:50S ribosomal protein L22 [Lentisphaerota bacterium]MBT4819145.1 50S ribosomal protein L22 [Lentisphaerota bacterium]MBT5607360.1 50S ribosomal protein L22 [Lentisphaerota bacterium]MBT7058370.1 50S ribosomal protein L22 [Lentisphaerota bacterium]MBT7841687.1 50S ribosomal protein L22 [Lentisphaerota bacterium]